MGVPEGGLIMKRHIVTYGLGGATTPTAQRERTVAQKWATANDGQILLSRRDGESLGSLDSRNGLHQALFCLRANLANVLWLPRWGVLGDVATQELVCAHVWAGGGEVVVGEETIDHLGAVPEEQQGLRDMAQTSVRLLTQADPRQESHDESLGQDPDIGEWDNDWERARLAHKLRFDFRLTLAETARVLNAANYVTEDEREHSGSSVQRLLAKHAEDLSVLPSAIVCAPGRGALDAIALVTFGPDAVAQLPSATKYNAALSRPFPHVFEVPLWGDLDRDLPSLVLGVKAMVFGGVYVSNESVLGDFLQREALYGQVWRYGGSVVVAGNPVDPDASVDIRHRVLRELARASARLFAILRAHDADTIVGGERSVAAARELARLKRDVFGWSYEEIADLLNRECFITRKGTGAWHAASVRELLL